MPKVEKNIDERKCLVLKMKRKLIFSISIGIILCLGVGFLAGRATQMSVKTWYSTLDKPFFTPPDAVFAPVWTLLYLLMGIAVGRIWHFGIHHRWGKTAVYHFGLQLLVNGLWSLVFFGLRNPIGGMVVIIILMLLIIRTLKLFKVIDLLSSQLLYPYLIWVFFASLLNGGIVLLNFS
jgi:benzodiazapine receptor